MDRRGQIIFLQFSNGSWIESIIFSLSDRQNYFWKAYELFTGSETPPLSPKRGMISATHSRTYIESGSERESDWANWVVLEPRENSAECLFCLVFGLLVGLEKKDG